MSSWQFAAGRGGGLGGPRWSSAEAVAKQREESSRTRRDNILADSEQREHLFDCKDSAVIYMHCEITFVIVV